MLAVEYEDKRPAVRGLVNLLNGLELCKNITKFTAGVNDCKINDYVVKYESCIFGFHNKRKDHNARSLRQR